MDLKTWWVYEDDPTSHAGASTLGDCSFCNDGQRDSQGDAAAKQGSRWRRRVDGHSLKALEPRGIPVAAIDMKLALSTPAKEAWPDVRFTAYIRGRGEGRLPTVGGDPPVAGVLAGAHSTISGFTAAAHA